MNTVKEIISKEVENEIKIEEAQIKDSKDIWQNYKKTGKQQNEYNISEDNEEYISESPYEYRDEFLQSIKEKSPSLYDLLTKNDSFKVNIKLNPNEYNILLNNNNVYKYVVDSIQVLKIRLIYDKPNYVLNTQKSMEDLYNAFKDVKALNRKRMKNIAYDIFDVKNIHETIYNLDFISKSKNDIGTVILSRYYNYLTSQYIRMSDYVTNFKNTIDIKNYDNYNNQFVEFLKNDTLTINEADMDNVTILLLSYTKFIDTIFISENSNIIMKDLKDKILDDPKIDTHVKNYFKIQNIYYKDLYNLYDQIYNIDIDMVSNTKFKKLYKEIDDRIETESITDSFKFKQKSYIEEYYFNVADFIKYYFNKLTSWVYKKNPETKQTDSIDLLYDNNKIASIERKQNIIKITSPDSKNSQNLSIPSNVSSVTYLYNVASDVLDAFQFKTIKNIILSKWATIEDILGSKSEISRNRTGMYIRTTAKYIAVLMFFSSAVIAPIALYIIKRKTFNNIIDDIENRIKNFFGYHNEKYVNIKQKKKMLHDAIDDVVDKHIPKKNNNIYKKIVKNYMGL